MKRLLVLALLFWSSLLLNGCRPQATHTQQGIVLEFWTLQLLPFADTLKPMFADYERQHPGLHIKWVDIPFSEGEKRTLTAMMSPKVPDVVNLNPDFSAILASRNAVLNLNDWVKPELRESYLPVAWQAASLKKPNMKEDFAFGIPWYLTSSVTLYNRELVQQAGYTSPPGALQDLETFGKRLQEKAQAYALMPTLTENGNFLKELQKAGIPLYNTQGKAIFADHGAASFLEAWVRLYQEHLIPAEALTEGHRAAVDRYQAGTLAMLLTGPNFLNIVKENAPAIFKKTDVAPQFPAHSHYTDFSTMVLIVPRKSQHPKEAVDFALFITNRVNQLALAQKAPVLPSVLAGLQDPYFQKQDSADLLERARSISAQQLLNAKSAYRIQPRQHEINEIVNQAVQRALLGKASVQDAVQQAQDEINRLL